MEEQLFDKLIYHLAQLNFEECFSLLESSQDNELKNALLMMVTFDTFYFSMDYVKDKDSQREEMLRLVDEIIEPIFLKRRDQMFDELLICLRTRQQAVNLYLELIRTEGLDDRLQAKCLSLLAALDQIHDYTLAPYQEAFQQELGSLAKVFEAQVALSHFNYLATLVSLKQAHLLLKKWEDVFVSKKYTPLHHNNSPPESNNVHKWLLNYLQILLGKASLYFDSFICGVRPRESVLSSTRIENQCLLLKVNYFALLLDINDENVRKIWEEQGYRCHSEKDAGDLGQYDSHLQRIYCHLWQSETTPREVEIRLRYMIDKELSDSYKTAIRTDREMDWTFYVARVDLHMFAVLAHVNKKLHSETTKMREFFAGLTSMLTRTTPPMLKQVSS